MTDEYEETHDEYLQRQDESEPTPDGKLTPEQAAVLIADIEAGRTGTHIAGHVDELDQIIEFRREAGKLISLQVTCND